ncbi:hypothetical protein MCERE1_02819 [Burkholderiaceae bacterium]
MNPTEPPPSWVPTLTQEIALNQAPIQAPAAHSPAQPFPSALDETRLCMMVTDQLLAQLPDLIRATVRAHLQQSPLQPGLADPAETDKSAFKNP